MTFKDLDLSPAILSALKDKGYTAPTPIQQQAIPAIMSSKDVMASAETGTGKTAAFCIPILERLMREKSKGGVRALILAPTRELCLQIFENLQYYGKNLPLRSTAVFGGVSQFHQVKDIRRGVDIIVATPGRLLDLANQRIVNFRSLEVLVLDEADRMFDMGFIADIKRLLAILPASRQNIFLSATLPKEVQSLTSSMLRDPIRIKIENKAGKVSISQSVYYVARDRKRALLKYVIAEQDMKNVIVFARTKHGADKIAKDLNKSGIIAEAFHGNKSQSARQRALNNFKKNLTRVLVATDIAARGIDIAELPYVINYELPETADTYTHRIGRTGRAGRTGWALSFCDGEEKSQLREMKKLFPQELSVVEHPFV